MEEFLFLPPKKKWKNLNPQAELPGVAKIDAYQTKVCFCGSPPIQINKI
jgi:hypothetical protein